MLAPERYQWLDLFRFLAALTVALVHVRGAVFSSFGALPVEQQSPLVALFYLFTRIGNEVVVAFFVLSGFLVGGKALERIASGTFQPIDYALDRFARIMLPLVPALLLTVAVVLLQGRDLNPTELVGNLLSLQGVLVDSYGGNANAPMWSLAYEVWFYILAGAIGVFALNRTWHLPSAVMLILVILVFTQLSPNYLFCWFIGALAFVRRPQKGSVPYLVFSLLLMVYAVACIQIGSDSVSISDGIQKALRRWVVSDDVSRIILSVGMALLIQQLILFPPQTGLATKLEMLGSKGAAFSYSLYLTHYPVIQLAPYFDIKQASSIDYKSFGNFFLLTGLCVLVALVVYWLFERHTSSVRGYLKAKLLKGRQGKTGSASSPGNPP